MQEKERERGREKERKRERQRVSDWAVANGRLDAAVGQFDGGQFHPESQSAPAINDGPRTRGGIGFRAGVEVSPVESPTGNRE